MKLDELHTLWEKESILDFSQPDKIIREIPLAHGRWWRFLTDEKQRYIVMKQEFDKLRHLKYQWYVGHMDDGTRIQLKWDPQPLRLIKSEVEDYIAVDPEIALLNGKLEVQKMKLEFIADCIKSISNRTFAVKNHLEWLRFSNGS